MFAGNRLGAGWQNRAPSRSSAATFPTGGPEDGLADDGRRRSPAAPPPAPDGHAREAAEVLLCAAFLLTVPTLPERRLAWIRQMAAVQRPATGGYIDRYWPKPVREALLGPDRPTA